MTVIIKKYIPDEIMIIETNKTGNKNTLKSVAILLTSSLPFFLFHYKGDSMVDWWMALRMLQHTHIKQEVKEEYVWTEHY